MIRYTLSILIALTLLVGCKPTEQSSATTDSPTQTVSTQDGSVQFRLYTDQSTLTTMEQIVLRIELDRDATATASLVEPDFQAAGWTLITEHTTPEKLQGDRLRTNWSFTLEPFLAGEYEIPSIVVETSSGMMTTDPITISVTSVLDVDDAGQLSATEQLFTPQDPPASSTNMYLAVGAVSGILLAAGVFWWVGRSHPSFETTPTEQLQTIADGRCTDQQKAIAIVHHAVLALETNEKLRPVRVACEHERFSGSTTNETDAEQLANQALRIMEDAT